MNDAFICMLDSNPDLSLLTEKQERKLVMYCGFSVIIGICPETLVACRCLPFHFIYSLLIPEGKPGNEALLFIYIEEVPG